MSNQDGGSRHRHVARAITLVAPLLGLGVFLFLDRGGDVYKTGEQELGIWKILITAQVIGWGVLVGVGIKGLGEIDRLVEERMPGSSLAWHARYRWETVRFLTLTYGVLGLLLVTGGVTGIKNAPLISDQWLKILLLHILGGLGAVPFFLALKRIQLVATDDRIWSASARDIERMRSLRGHLRTITAALGMTIAFAVISSGALRSAVEAVEEVDLTPLPSSFILIYGGWFTGVLAAVYLHVFASLERRARAIMEEAAPLPDPSLASAESFARTTSLRGVLSQELELGGDPRKNLEGLIAVFSPLIGSLLSLAGLGT